MSRSTSIHVLYVANLFACMLGVRMYNNICTHVICGISLDDGIYITSFCALVLFV